MTTTVSEFLDAALALPEPDRAELAKRLAASLTGGPRSRLHPAWAAELRRRAHEIDSGSAEAVPLEEVRRRVRAQLESGEVADG